MSTETRFILFTVFAGIILVSWMFVSAILNPQQPQLADGDPANEGEVDEAENNEVPEGEVPEGETPEEETPAEQPQEPEAPPVVIEPLSEDLAQRWLTLGSYDPESGYRMLVTLNSQGGTVERVELNSPQLRDLDDFSGYMGYLAMRSEAGRGCRVNVVPAGTPAESAGLQGPQYDEEGVQTLPGDLILSLNGDSTPGVSEFDVLMNKRKPGETIALIVERASLDSDNEITLKEIELKVELTSHPAQVVRPEKELRPAEEEEFPLSLGMTLSNLGGSELRSDETELAGIDSLYKGVWQSRYIEEGRGVEFSIIIPNLDAPEANRTGMLRLIRRYRLAPLSEEAMLAEEDGQGYHLSMEIEIENLLPEKQTVGYRLRGPTGLPLEGWWYGYRVHPTRWASAGTRDLIWRSLNEEDIPGEHRLITCSQVVKHVENAEEKDENRTISMRNDEDSNRLLYAGCDAQYYTAAILPDPQEGDAAPLFAHARAIMIGEKDKLNEKRSAITFQLDSKPQSLAPHGAEDNADTLTQHFTLFLGPKQPTLLKEYQLEDVVVYGWPIIRMVAKPMQVILHFLYGLVHNYGIAIILLTVMVRGILSPLGRKVAMDSKRMQEIRPELDKIKEQYKNDSAKLMKAQRELMRENKCNPMGGCVLMFFQLPIFIGLYRALSVDIELRGASLLPGNRWCSNLAAPDMLFRWDDAMANVPLLGGMAQEGGWLGPYFNILPLFTVVLFLVQQKVLTPPATTDEQRLQQKVMSFMTLFIGFMFFKVQAGLCIYFITSSLWGIAERKLLPSRDKKKKEGEGAEEEAKEAAKPSRKTSESGAAIRAAQQKRKKKGKKKN